MKPSVIILHSNCNFSSDMRAKLSDFGFETIIISILDQLIEVFSKNNIVIIIADFCDDDFWLFSKSDFFTTYTARANIIPVNAINYVAYDSHKIETYYQMVALTAKISCWRSQTK